MEMIPPSFPVLCYDFFRFVSEPLFSLVWSAYSHLMWSGNERYYRFDPFMFISLHLRIRMAVFRMGRTPYFSE